MIKSLIHPTAVVSPKAYLAEGVEVGPFCVIEDDVSIGENTRLLSHVVVSNGARIGNSVVIHPGAVIATAPQDLKYAGEPTEVFVGDNTTIRECVTINRGTTASGKTIVGSHTLLMAYSHVAHDCVVGNNIVIANAVQLGGHVQIGDWAIIGGNTGIHQFSKIGAHCMIAACIMVTKDCPPFTLVGRDPVGVEQLNTIGLRRRGFSPDSIAAIENFYHALYFQQMNITEAVRNYQAQNPSPLPEVQLCIEFILSSKRGVYRSSHA